MVKPTRAVTTAVLPPPGNREAARQRRYGWLAVGLVAVGLGQLAFNLAQPLTGWAQIGAYGPGLLVAAAVGWLVAARRPFLSLPRFSFERGTCTTGAVWLSAGEADARVEALGAGLQLAAGQFPNYAGPRLAEEGAQVRLTLDRQAAAPLLGGVWAAGLNPGLPWALEVRSNVGDLTLNLRDLTVPLLKLDSLAGDVDLTLPAAGQATMELRLGLGNLTLRLPENVSARFKLQAGALVNFWSSGRRLVRVAPDEWTTPGLPAAGEAAQCRLNIHMLTGDLRVL